MKHFRLFLHAMLFLMSASIICSDAKASRSIHTKFVPYTTEQFFYTQTNQAICKTDDISYTQGIISDVTTKSYFSTGIKRTLVCQEVQDDIVIITTQTWQTNNPSYLTWTNSIAACILITIPAMIMLLQKHACIMYTSDKLLTYLLTHKEYKTKTINLLADKVINQRLITEHDIATAVGELGLQQLKRAVQSL